MILIVGAGLAGLACAHACLRRGEEDFLLVEAGSEPGGRVRSRRTPDGFTLDRGFQVALDSYPALHRLVDLETIEPRFFESGAILLEAGRASTVANPFRHPADLISTALSDAFSAADRTRLAVEVAQLFLISDDALLAKTRSARDVSAAHWLFARGFSSAIVERVFRPFFGGVLLDDRLATSAALLRYYLKKFATGRAFVPARGMGEITRQLAQGIPQLRLNCAIERIERNHAIAAGGERIPFRRLVLATDAPATARILCQPPPAPGLGVTTVYFRSAKPLYDRAMLALPAGRRRRVRHFVQLSNVAPEYAPPGQHLLSASILGVPPEDDDSLAEVARSEIALFYPAARRLEFIAAERVVYAQHFQPPRFGRVSPPPLPPNVTLAGDQTGPCSIQSALASGERAV